MKKIIPLLIGALFSGLVIAGPTMTTQIEKVRVRPSVAYLKLKGCPRYSIVRINTEYDKAMYSAALAAAAGKKDIYVEFEADDGCQSTESKFKVFEVIY